MSTHARKISRRAAFVLASVASLLACGPDAPVAAPDSLPVPAAAPTSTTSPSPAPCGTAAGDCKDDFAAGIMNRAGQVAHVNFDRVGVSC